MTLVGSLDAAVEPDRVSFVFAVENVGDEPVALSFRDAQTAEFAVLDGEDEHWRWSEGRLFAQVLRSADLAPGESVTDEAAWDRPKSGTHTAVATLEAETHDCEARTEFSV